jgi:alpha-ribazole phosphatase
MRRCLSPAKELAVNLGLPLHVEPRFREIGLGRCEGRAFHELDPVDAHALQEAWRDPQNNGIPDGEAFADFRARVLDAWRDVARDSGAGSTLVIAHGGTIRIILAAAREIPPRECMQLSVPLASLTLLRVRTRPGSEPHVGLHSASPGDSKA